MIARKKVSIIILLLIFYCTLILSKKVGKETLDEENSSEWDSAEEFKPTNEWQPVKKGQPIPRGLHVRLNLQTGETEAKLLSDSNNERTDVLSVHDDDNLGLEEDTETNEHFRAVKESLLKLQNQEKENDMVDTVRENFRSYKELKETFKKLNMTVKTDLEIMHELVHKIKNLLKSKDKASLDEMLTVLIDLEYLVHQIDNALEFVKLEGVSDIVLPMLNSTRPTLRAEAARLLGSAAQSNIKVQIAALENGAISSLLRAVSLDTDNVVRIRSLYALSCLIRNFPVAQARFVKEGGISVLVQLFEKGKQNSKLQLKVITLLYDLLSERQDAVKLVSEDAVNKDELNMKIKQYKAVGLEETLYNHGWCSRIANILLAQNQNWGRTKKRDDLASAVSDLPVRPEHDFVEKVSDTILAMVDICHYDFNINSDFKRMIISLKEWYLELASKEDLNIFNKYISDSSSENDDDEDYLYYSGIANILERVTVKLDSYNSNDEL